MFISWHYVIRQVLSMKMLSPEKKQPFLVSMNPSMHIFCCYILYYKDVFVSDQQRMQQESRDL